MSPEVEDWEWQLDRAMTDAYWDLVQSGKPFHLSDLVTKTIDYYKDRDAYLKARHDRIEDEPLT